MGANQRLTSLESALEGKERIFAWFKKAQALGGFLLEVDFEWILDYCQRYAIQIDSGEEFEDVHVRAFLDILLGKRAPKVWFGELVMTTN